MVFSFQYFFTMKRVEIQMNENNVTLSQTIKALKEQLRREKCVNFFYVLLSLFLLLVAIVAIYTLVADDFDDSNAEDLKNIYLTCCILCFQSIIFLIELLTVIYFKKMANNFMDMLAQVYPIRKKLVNFVIFVISFWTMICNARLELYFPIINIVAYFKED